MWAAGRTRGTNSRWHPRAGKQPGPNARFADCGHEVSKSAQRLSRFPAESKHPRPAGDVQLAVWTLQQYFESGAAEDVWNAAEQRTSLQAANPRALFAPFAPSSHLLHQWVLPGRHWEATDSAVEPVVCVPHAKSVLLGLAVHREFGSRTVSNFIDKLWFGFNFDFNFAALLCFLYWFPMYTEKGVLATKPEMPCCFAWHCPKSTKV